jgi:ketosteroid isomerase-like protein
MTRPKNPVDAEHAFYAAFAGSNFAAMMALWAPHESVVCVHPLGPRLSGREAIAESWRQILTADAQRHFELEIKSTWQSGDLAVHMLDEVISVPGSGARFRPVIATNVYQCVGGDWFIVEHHASIDASDPPAGPATGATRH